LYSFLLFEFYREDEPEDKWPELGYEVDARGRRWSELDKEFMGELLRYTAK